MRTYLALLIFSFFSISIHAQQEISADGVLVADTVEYATIGGETIYYSENKVFYCDGRYHYDTGNEDAKYFEVELEKLNPNDFDISFDFKAEKSGCVLMLSHCCRVLGIEVDDEGHVYFNINNHDNKFITQTTYTPGQYTHIDLYYQKGTLKINDEEFVNIVLETPFGDDTLSSCDYSCGKAFKGMLKNIDVTSFFDN